MAPCEQLALAVNRVPFLRPLEKFRVMDLCPTARDFAGLSRRDLEEILRRRFDDPGWPSQKRRVRSLEPEMIRSPSGLRAIE